jgi:hypothetical protein
LTAAAQVSKNCEASSEGKNATLDTYEMFLISVLKQTKLKFFLLHFKPHLPQQSDTIFVCRKHQRRDISPRRRSSQNV